MFHIFCVGLEETGDDDDVILFYSLFVYTIFIYTAGAFVRWPELINSNHAEYKYLQPLNRGIFQSSRISISGAIAIHTSSFRHVLILSFSTIYLYTRTSFSVCTHQKLPVFNSLRLDHEAWIHHVAPLFLIWLYSLEDISDITCCLTDMMMTSFLCAFVQAKCKRGSAAC